MINYPLQQICPQQLLMVQQPSIPQMMAPSAQIPILPQMQTPSPNFYNNPINNVQTQQSLPICPQTTDLSQSLLKQKSQIMAQQQKIDQLKKQIAQLQTPAQDSQQKKSNLDNQQQSGSSPSEIQINQISIKNDDSTQDSLSIQAPLQQNISKPLMQQQENQQQQFNFSTSSNFYFNLNDETNNNNNTINNNNKYTNNQNLNKNNSSSIDFSDMQKRRRSTTSTQIILNANNKQSFKQHKDSDKSTCSALTVRISEIPTLNESLKKESFQSISPLLQQNNQSQAFISSTAPTLEQISAPDLQKSQKCLLKLENQTSINLQSTNNNNNNNNQQNLNLKNNITTTLQNYNINNPKEDQKRKRSSQGEIYQLKQSQRLEDVYKRHGRNLYPYFGLHFFKDLNQNKEFQSELQSQLVNTDNNIREIQLKLRGKTLKTKKEIEETIMEKHYPTNVAIKLWLTKYLLQSIQNTKDSHNNKIRDTHEQRIAAFTIRSKQILQVLNECL